MPRDSTETRARLLEEAERLFATKGIHRATSREIREAANQRNSSAVTYHFGSRSGLLWEILRLHGDVLDQQRGRLLDKPARECSTRDLVSALVIPYGGCLTTTRGRNYLRIVSQLADQFPLWRVGEVSANHLNGILDALESRVPAEPPVRRQRIVSAIMTMTTSSAERARQIDGGVPSELGHARFLSDLVDVMEATLSAPVGPALAVIQGSSGPSAHVGGGIPTRRRARVGARSADGR